MTIIVDSIRVTPTALRGPKSKSIAPATIYYLAQTPILDKAQLEQLDRLGVAIHDRFAAEEQEKGGATIRKMGFLWRIPVAVLNQVRQLDFVELLEPFDARFKIAPSLVGLVAGSSGAGLRRVSTAVSKSLSGDQYLVRIDLHDDVEASNLIVARLVEASVVAQPEEPAVFPRTVRPGPGGRDRVTAARIFLTTTADRIAAIAAIEEVRRITQVPNAMLANNVARKILRVPWAPSVAPSSGAQSFLGEGEVVAVADTGFDLGSATIVPTAFEGTFNEERVIKLYPIGREGDADDPHGHGTHVAGSIVGADLVPADPNGGDGVFGIAPRARLVVQALYQANWDPLGGLKKLKDITSLFVDPYECHGARVHNNSWGRPSIEYESWSRVVDEVVETHRDLVIVICAGNDGVATSDNSGIALGSIWAPGNAKNCITVGASESLRDKPVWRWNDRRFDGKFKKLPTRNRKIAANEEGVAPFSSRGPVIFNRTKPDLVAPGTLILSTRSGITQDEGFGLAPDYKDFYVFKCGTSMSAPLVAGCALIVREYLRKARGRATPSAALVKAVLINGARQIRGPYSGESIPNNHQGFGLVDLSAALGQDGRSVELKDEDDSAALDSSAESGDEKNWTKLVAVPAGATLKVTLVWTDPPDSALQNDLNMVVKSLGTNEEWHGNMPRGSTAFDRHNNAEQVTWEDYPGGEAEITVVAELTLRPPQTFALVYSIAVAKARELGVMPGRVFSWTVRVRPRGVLRRDAGGSAS